MESEILEKIKKLSPELKAELESEEFLAKLDELDAAYGVKGILILLKLVLKELAYADLADYLKQEYGFNEFIAEKIKVSFGLLIKDLGNQAVSTPVQTSPFSAIAKPQPLSNAFSEMIFSREDEEEVSQIKVFSGAEIIDYDLLADKIIASFELKPLDEALMKRLRNIIVSRLKDIRDELETREILVKDKKIGGLGLSVEEAETLVKVIKNFNANGFDALPLPLRSTQPEKTVKIQSAVENLPTVSPEHELLVIEDDADGLPVIKLPSDYWSSANTISPSRQSSASLSHETDSNEIKKLSKPDQNAKITTSSPLPKKVLPAPQPVPFVAAKKIPESVLLSRNSQRPNLDGVKFEKKLAGPIEELSGMTLIDFRRISADPKIIVNKIQEKISLLGEENFKRRIDGITAWHQNEVNKFYRLLGQTSMSEGQPVEEIIKDRLLANKPTLSIDEFYAIMELNKALRY